MEQKLIFLDIDGTLLPPGADDASPRAVEAIRRARAAGHKVFLCTGRNLRMTQPLLRYGFDGCICSAGGYVVCGDTVLVDLPMRPDQVQGLREVLTAHGVECTLEALDGTYGGSQMIARYAAQASARRKPLNSEAARWLKAIERGMTINSLGEYHGEPIYKIVYIAPNEASLDEARRRYESEFVFCESLIDDNTGGIVNGELINRAFSKGSGVKAICRHLGVSLADTVGFGDSDNDLDMARTVGLSVCMANGSPSLKALAQRICPSVDEDGVAQELEALGLI